jgi:hypothetical protein
MAGRPTPFHCGDFLRSLRRWRDAPPRPSTLPQYWQPFAPQGATSRLCREAKETPDGGRFAAFRSSAPAAQMQVSLKTLCGRRDLRQPLARLRARCVEQASRACPQPLTPRIGDHECLADGWNPRSVGWFPRLVLDRSGGLFRMSALITDRILPSLAWFSPSTRACAGFPREAFCLEFQISVHCVAWRSTQLNLDEEDDYAFTYSTCL